MADKITEKDLVEGKVYEIGKKYEKSLQPAIDANEIWVATFEAVKKAALDYANIEKQFANAKGRTEFLKLKQEEAKLRKETANAVKAEQDALKKTQQTKQSLLNTEKKVLQVEAAKARQQQRNTKTTIAQRLEIQRKNKAEKEEAILTSNTSTFLERLTVKRERAARVVQDLNAKKALGEKLSRRERNELRQSERQFVRYDKAVKVAKESVGRFQENVGNYPRLFSAATSSIRSFVSALGLTSGVLIFAQAVRNGFEIFKQYDQAQADLAAILGRTRSEITALTEQSKEYGATTAFTATQVSALQLELAKLGFDDRSILDATLGVENLAIATGVDAARAAKLAGAALRGFNLDATESNRVAAALAVSTTKSASSFETLEVALPKVSAIANSFDFTIEDTTALLGGLQNAGFEASIAGTSLRQIFLQLADSNGKLAKRLGGGAKNFDELIDQFKKVEEEGISLGEAFNLTNARSVAAFKVFLQGADDMRELRDGISDVIPELDALANEKLNSVQGELTLLNSAWEGWILSMDESGDAANTLKGTIEFLRKNLSQILNTIIKVGKAFLIYKAILIGVNLVTKGYTIATTALRFAKIALAGGIGKATIAMKAFNLATKANPIGLLLSVLAGGIATWLAFRDGVRSTAEELREVKREAESARDALVDANIATVKARLSQIEDEVANEKKAIDKKIEFVEEEIQARRSGNRLLEEITTEANKKNEEEQKKHQERLAKIREEGFDFRTQPRQRVDERSRGNGPVRENTNVGQRLVIDVTPVLNEDSEQKTVKELQKLLVKLAGEKDKSDKKQAEKEDKEAKRRAAKLRSDRFALNSFIIQSQIDLFSELAENELADFDSRLQAFEAQGQKEIELAKLIALEKFTASSRFSQDEINQIIENGFISTEQRKKATDAELLIIGQFQKKKKEILSDQQSGNVDLEFERIIEQGEKEKAQKEKQLNDQLALENQRFRDTIGIYESEEQALEAHEQRKAEIKKKYALEGLEIQVQAIERLLKTEELSAQQRAEYEKQLSALKLEISEINTEDFKAKSDEEVEAYGQRTAEILQLASELATALGDLADAIFSARIQRIDERIEREQEATDQLLSNENLSDEQITANEINAEARRQALEKKKAEEQRKQAIAQKAIAATNVVIQTSLGVISALAQVPKFDFGISAAALAATIGTIGAIQLAAVLAQPIPQFFMGTDNFEGGLAEVSEIRPEVITEPGKKPYIQKNRAILNLPKGTRITPSIEEYNNMMRQEALQELGSNHAQIMKFNTATNYILDSSEIVKELRLNRKATEKNRPRKNDPQKKTDIPHELFKYKNTNWS